MQACDEGQRRGGGGREDIKGTRAKWALEGIRGSGPLETPLDTPGLAQTGQWCHVKGGEAGKPCSRRIRQKRLDTFTISEGRRASGRDLVI